MIVRWANRPNMWKAVFKESRYCPHIAITSEYMGGSIVLYLEDDHAKVRTVTYSRMGSYPQDIAFNMNVEDVSVAVSLSRTSSLDSSTDMDSFRVSR